MSVRRREDGVIVLEGACPVEDAEPLLQLLQDEPRSVCDWTGCNQLHTAVVQVLLMIRPPMSGPCGDPWFEQWMAPLIANRPQTGQP